MHACLTIWAWLDFGSNAFGDLFTGSWECKTSRDVSDSVVFKLRRGRSTIYSSLQSGAMDDLVVHSKLTASIIDDQNANTATAVGEGLVKSRP